MWAAANGHFDICEDLLNRHADMNAQSTDRVNAMTVAASCGREKIVVLLLKKGASSAPPRALLGKRKRLEFVENVTWSTRESILRKLRAAKHA